LAAKGEEDARQAAYEGLQGGQPTATTEVPECPALSPSVEIAGELQESGFKDRQWLIQRDGHFIQLSELLYRIVERIDGERTLKEIAAKVTESSEWMVSADNVQYIIQAKLIPLGLVATADGSVMSRDGEQGGRSALAINARIKIFGPRIINPIAKVLQILFVPPVLIAVLMIAALAYGWLFLVHGVMQSIIEVIYTPSLTLIVIAAMWVAGIFHEFGHAAALRYGGGTVRRMGAGFYLVYPVLFTDTTDSYRLGKWGRVRTDLGGFYFNLIFLLGIVALYMVTGWEFLLVIVLMITIDMVFQCLPFVRFDGYWALADLVGIPDFFSQMGAFIRSILPVKRWKGVKLPNLKPQVKVAFATYIIVTVPVLSLLVFSLVSSLPVLATATWDSMLTIGGMFSFDWGEGRYLAAAVSALQILMLELEVAATALLLFGLSRTLIKVIWKWSKPTRMRRMAGVLISLGIIALVAYLWTM